MKSEKKEVRMFVCEFCGKEYLNKKEAEFCEKNCSARKQKEEDHAKRLETHKPKFKVGDIVRFSSELRMNSCDVCNLYLTVDKISSEYYGNNTWSYYGEVGYSYGDDWQGKTKSLYLYRQEGSCIPIIARFYSQTQIHRNKKRI